MNDYYDALTIYKRPLVETLHGNLIFFKNIFVGGINARIPTGVSVHKVRILSCFNRRWGYEFFRYHLKNRMVAANSVMPPIV